MLVWTIFSLFKINQESVNSLFVQLQCASSLRDGILLFYSGIDCQKSDVAYLFRLCLVCELGL